MSSEFVSVISPVNEPFDLNFTGHGARSSYVWPLDFGLRGFVESRLGRCELLDRGNYLNEEANGAILSRLEGWQLATSWTLECAAMRNVIWLKGKLCRRERDVGASRVFCNILSRGLAENV